MHSLIFHIYRDAVNQYRWRLLAANGRTIANSGEGYYNRQDCVHAINLVASSNGAPIQG